MSFHRSRCEEQETEKILNILEGFLIESIRNVETKYIVSYDVKLRKTKAQLERVFAYELYHQWSCLLKASDYGLDLEINGEPYKCLHSKQHFYEPDLVLHGGQYCYDNNFIVCEIKRAEGLTTDKIMLDLQKFLYFFNEKYFEGYPYLRASFIVVNADRRYLEEMLSKEKIKKWQKSKTKSIKGNRIKLYTDVNGITQKVICITKDSKNKIDYFNLSEIYNKQL